ncbi:MAG: efflux RND transporter periplasmic adaptor subunit [Thermoguttaceae bacterium]|nr:efflux RND transporter periplasmic adaptor subunit [Thermoguttaceae bacterium]MDW8037731.1 HlyD family efflux transporter periplasmic adaptor subunit [Thermoguttaceae bacterium]
MSSPAYSNPTGYPNCPGHPVAGRMEPGALRNDRRELGTEQLRGLADQIGQLVRSDLRPEEFYAEFLKRVVPALGADRGIIWTVQKAEPPRLVTEVQSGRDGLSAENPPPASSFQPTRGQGAESAISCQVDWACQAWHQELVRRATATPLAAPPQRVEPATAAGSDTPPAGGWPSKNPTGWLLLFAPIVTEAEQAVVVELVLSASCGLAAPRYLRLLAQMAELASRYFRRRRLQQLQEEVVFWRQLEQFAQQVHARLEVAWAAYTLVNEGRRLLGCDRLSLLIKEAKGYRVAAISGSADFDPRSPALRLLRRLTQVVLDAHVPLYYDGNSDSLPPQVQSLVENYVDLTHTKALLILPLWPSEKVLSQSTGPGVGEEEQSMAAGSAEPDVAAGWGKVQPIGALVLEQYQAAEISAPMRQRLELLAQHGQIALSHALRYEGIFLRRVWEALGRQGWVVWSRSWPKWAWVAVGGLILTGLLIWTPARLEIEATGTLEPVVRQDVFAGIDGRVEKVLVCHGDQVEGPEPTTGRPGTLLCMLRNYELEEEFARITGERATLEERLAAVSRALLERQLGPVESDRLSAEQAALRQRLQSLEAQLAVCRRKQEQLYIYSPIAGQVITWDVAGLLQHRPVQRGDRLLRIAKTDGPWQVELQVPEDRIGHVLRAKYQADGPLRVRFLLAADPTVSYEGQLVELDSTAQERPGGGRSILAKVQIEASQIHALVPGSQVRARVDCGRCSLGYRWFHDLGAWLRRVWFQW